MMSKPPITFVFLPLHPFPSMPDYAFGRISTSTISPIDVGVFALAKIVEYFDQLLGVRFEDVVLHIEEIPGISKGYISKYHAPLGVCKAHLKSAGFVLLFTWNISLQKPLSDIGTCVEETWCRYTGIVE